jgi:hypothetical protein
VRSLSPVEAAVAFAVAASVLAVAVPEFLRGLQASRLAEPVDGLKRIASAAVALAANGSGFPAPAPRTPQDVPRGTRAEDPAGVWEHPTWRALVFGFDHPHAFSFAFESTQGPAGQARFRAVAHGDLDGDGVTSTFEVRGEADPAGSRIVPGMYVDREVE